MTHDGSAMLMRLQRLQLAIANTRDGFFQIRTVLILGLGNAADAIEILSIGYILAVYEDMEGVVLSRTQQTIFAGMLTGGLLFGSLSDQIGRRKSLLYSLMLNGVFALMSALAPNAYALITFRASNPFANAFIYAAANLPGNIMTAVLMDRLGGRRILGISMLLSACCATGFAYANSSAAGAAAIVLLASGFNAFSTAGWNAIDLMSAESFPTDVRTTGMGMLSAAGRAGSVVAQFVNGYLIGPPVHLTLLLSITAIMMLLGSASSVLVRDYSNKTLPESVEEMRAEMKHKDEI
ncbi:hypothetical protein BBO99_00006170 [Phytophthora kernoviae]|uniref:Major facilitator superfamily (MFS) profile domain-containing protein n=2 Tax=Phytophthora kernoviae TaxID=325452 RepID=A0A3R7JSK4_9STRA|nr:hypothetical protein G195_009865 [Phytophthora kernoviae 00238/432]KAG2523054.1 hypothetical protein JM18_005902 [Phytophthora kernoviae]KAG2524581.1 hypothetical protein JM16_003614 [Phytophthora kernoviae]RLN10195.1 hypothetical protein BBI17_004100 [Phytophthora kernoviae]RLN78155.1 hypothetical protein BBO99_00006170 [Phytophthora kernoviae]